MKYKQEAPFAIQIELTEGCNRGCSFCGLQGIRKEGKAPFYFMDRKTASAILSEIVRIGWHSRLIFSMHGEPTLNKNCLKIIKMFRKQLPNSIISIMTNGYSLANGIHSVEDFKAAGINDLIVDLYEDGDDGNQFKDTITDYQILGKSVPLYGTSPKKFRILFNPPIQTEEGAAINRHLCNHCGAAGPLDYSYENKKCARPFRELTFRYNGSVAICCNDFRGEYPIGNIHDMSIDEIWQHKRFQAARIILYNGKRNFKPCLGCNALSHRVGLLPDKRGKLELPEPSEKIIAYAKSISKKEQPLCGDNFNLRPWEVHNDE